MSAQPPRTTDPQQRIRAHRRRIHRLRVRAAATAVGLFVALWAVTFGQLASAQQATTAATTTQTTAAATPTTTQTTAAATPTATQSVTPVTTRQS